jgi:hypothetical protein
MSQIDNGNYSYLGNANIKRDGVEHDFTKEEIQEYVKCSKDPVYFAKKYMKVIHLDRGLVPFDLYPYQEKMITHLNDNRFSVILACRQSGKSITSVCFLLWTALFQPEQTVAILANKAAIAKEMLGRITLALENIPFFLQPGCKALNKLSIDFSNNSKIFAASTSSSSIRGTSCNVIFLDEFAFVYNANEFYTSTYPVISSGESTKVIVTSTANGIGNMFYKIWEGAVQGANGFKAFRVDWWDVPGRDEKWKDETIANTSEIQFKQEFGNSFIGTTSTLIEADVLLGLQAAKPIKSLYTDSLRIYEEPQWGHSYILTVDVSQGRGKDYSAFSVIDVTEKPFKQVVAYSNNKISPLMLPNIVVKTAEHFHDALLIIENNGPGQIVCNSVYYDYEYENTFVESAIKAGGIGVTQTRKTKKVGVSTLKDMVEEDVLVVEDANTILELSYFEEKGSSYEAKNGKHDDLVMTLVLFAWFISSTAFSDYSEKDVRQMLYEDRLKQMDEELLDFGFLSSSPSNAMKNTEHYERLKEDLEKWSLNS